MKTTPSHRTDLSRLCREATPGPWENGGEAGIPLTFDDEANIYPPDTVKSHGFQFSGPVAVVNWRGEGGSPDGANAAFVTAARTALPDLLEDVRELETALRRLVEKLDAVHGDPRYLSVWMLYANHGGNYTEPTYENELNAAREALKGK